MQKVCFILIYDLADTISWVLTMSQVLCSVLYILHCVEFSKEIYEMGFLILISDAAKLKFRVVLLFFFIGQLMRNSWMAIIPRISIFLLGIHTFLYIMYFHMRFSFCFYSVAKIIGANNCSLSEKYTYYFKICILFHPSVHFNRFPSLLLFPSF